MTEEALPDAEPGGSRRLRDADELVAPSVMATINALRVAPEDAALVKMAVRYAETIDQHDDPAWAMRWLGPLLLDCLNALGATPAARSAASGGKVPPLTGGKPNRLAQLRAAHGA